MKQHAFVRWRAVAAWVAALAISLMLAACDFGAMMPQEHVDFAKMVVTLLRNRDAEGLEAISDPRLWPQLPPDLRAHMSGAFPQEAETSVTVAQYRASSVNSVANVTVVLRYVFPHDVVMAAVSFCSAEHGYLLIGLRVSRGADEPPTPDSTSTTRDL